MSSRALLLVLCGALLVAPAFAQEENNSGVIPLTIKNAPATEAAEEAEIAPELEPQKLFNTVLLRGLNKVTARAVPIDVPFGTVARFGNLEIIARACWQSPPEQRPENAALLELWELKPDEGPTHLFTGWMFSSSPSLSSLEHPVYDLTVVRCESRKIEGE